MPNLLTVMMPEMAAATLRKNGVGPTSSGEKTAFLSGGCQADGSGLPFAATLGDQLTNATAWLNLTPEGKVPAALMLPPDGKGLPLGGEPLQSAKTATDGDGDADTNPLMVIGLPVLPPGMTPLEANPAGAADTLGAADIDGVAGAIDPAVSDVAAALLSGDKAVAGATANKAQPVLATLVSNAADAGGETDLPALPADAAGEGLAEALSQLARQAVAGDRKATLQEGGDTKSLRGLVQALQGGDGAANAAATAPSPSASIAHNATATANAATLPQFGIDVPPGHPDWGDALGDRVAWMLNNHQPGAQLRINPPHLGPLEIRVSVHNDQASVSFTAHHAVTADHLQAALPRLREMLADNGMQLAQFDVHHQGSGAEAQNGSGQGAGTGGDYPAALDGSDEGEAVTMTTVLPGDGLLDAYA